MVTTAQKIEKIRREAIVDEMGKLGLKIEELKTAEKRYDALRKEAMRWFEESPADETFEVQGLEYIAAFGVKAEQRVITSIRKLARRLTMTRFWKIAKVTLGDLDKVMTIEEQQASGLVTEDRTGPRRLTLTKKEIAA